MLNLSRSLLASAASKDSSYGWPLCISFLLLCLSKPQRSGVLYSVFCILYGDVCSGIHKEMSVSQQAHPIQFAMCYFYVYLSVALTSASGCTVWRFDRTAT